MNHCSEGTPARYSSAGMTVSFAPDGTANQTMMNGRQMSVHWCVDAQGQLHAGLAGHDDSAAAWIAGDTLTISMGKMALALQRQTA